MASSIPHRRSTFESDEEDSDSRESTPTSTAANDRKRARVSVESSPSLSPQPEVVRPRKATQNNNVLAQDDRKFGLAPKRKHQPGAIIRVTLTNFVTYTSATFYPGPNLNMVIGPNGTGKSTLVCAICLGLGWGPELLGRAKDISEFVKHGSKKAEIEIELQKGPGEHHNPVVVRKIRKEDNSSEFLLDGKQSTKKAVQSVARRLNIQCDNLCQFLPQDRVVEFAQLTPEERLVTTLRAAAEPEVLQYHQKLIEERQKQRELMADNRGDREHLDSLKQKQEQMKPEVERFAERFEIEKHIKNLKLCRPIPKFREAKAKTSELKAIRDRLARETTALKEETEPVLRGVNAKQKYAKAAERRRDAVKKEVTRAERECDRVEQQITRAVQQIDDFDKQVDVTRQTRKDNRTAIGKLESEYANLRGRRAHEPAEYDTNAANEKIRAHTVRTRELRQQIEEKSDQLNPIMRDGKEKQKNLKDLKARLESLDTAEGAREDKLTVLSSDTAKAWKWIKENQDKFTGPIYGPPLITCSIKNPEMTALVETFVQMSDLLFFTATNQHDFDMLQSELSRKQNLHDLHFRTTSKTDLSSYRSPVDDETMQRMGLEQWVIDLLAGPMPVLAMLCENNRLHMSAITTSSVSDEQEHAIAESDITSYIEKDKLHKYIRRKEYGVASTVIGDAKREATFWVDKPVDEERKVTLQRQMRECSEQHAKLAGLVKELTADIKAAQEEMKAEDEALHKIQEEKESAQQARISWQGLETKMTHVDRRIQSLRESINATGDQIKDILQQQTEVVFQKAQYVLDYCDATHVLKDAHANVLEAEVTAIEARSDFEVLEARNKHIRETLLKKEEDLKKKTKEWEEMRQQAKSFIEEARQMMEEANRLNDDEDDDSLLQLANAMSRPDSQTTVDLLEADIEVEEAKLSLHDGGLDAAKTIKEYEDRGRKIQEMEEKLVDYNEQQALFVENIQTIRRQFEADLHPIIEQIDKAFSESFSRIGCAGEVSVYKASSDNPADCTEELGGSDNGLDFVNWAIHIRVKFREHEPLSLLDSHRQSGGERAVSTIFYLMALQSLSKSPFRVVDEINQGMDQRNERMVHGRMVDIATANEQAVAQGKASGSQYFLITPKLLSGLRYEKGMTVLCIVSGENVPAAEHENEAGKVLRMDMRAFAARAGELSRRYARMNMNGQGGGGEMGSGMGMRSVSVNG